MPEQNSSPPNTLLARSMRLFFRLLYHPLAWSYDFVAAAVSLGRWKRWVLISIGLLKGQRVLELGYGPGHLQAYLHGAGFHAMGLDESFQMAQQASRRLVRRRYAPRLARGLAQYLPFPAHAFESAVATFPTNYIYDADTLAEILRVLLPGGRLVILVAAWITGKSLADRFMAWLFRVTAQAPPQNHDFYQLLDIFTQAGFKAELKYIDLTDRRGQPSSRLMFIIGDKE